MTRELEAPPVAGGVGDQPASSTWKPSRGVLRIIRASPQLMPAGLEIERDTEHKARSGETTVASEWAVSSA